MRQIPHWFSGNEIIPLDSATQPGILISGSAVVFAVDKETQQRTHLFSIERGEPVLPVSPPPHAPWRLIVVPLEESCVEFYKDEPEVSGLFAMENWLAKIGAAMSVFSGAKEPEPARPGKVILAPGKSIAVGEGLDFVRLDSGGGLLACAPVKQGSTIALAPGLWLEAGEAEVEWTVLSCAPDNAAAVLRMTLDLAMHVFLDLLQEAAQRREREESERLATRREMDSRMMAGAVQALSGAHTRQAVWTTTDHLQAAVSAVAEALGCGVRPAAESDRAADRLRAIAEASGLRTRVVLLSGQWWQHENGPLVAFRENGSPVALLPAKVGFFGGARYRIFDPATGSLEPVTAGNTADLNAFARMIYRPLPADLSTKGLVLWLLRARRKDLRTIALTAVCAAILAMAAPQGAAILISQAIPDADGNMIWQVAAGIIAAAFGAALFLLAQAVATLRAQTAAWQAMQIGVWDHLLRTSPSFFRRFTVGQLRMRADAVTRIQQMLTADALRSLFAGLASFLTLALIFWYSMAMGWIALLCGAAVAAVCWLGSRALFRVQRQWQETDEVLSGLVLQAINAVSKLRVAGAANRAFAQWAHEYSRKQNLAVHIRVIQDRVRVVNMTMPAAVTTLAFFYLLRSPIATGPFLACITALNVFVAAVTAGSDTVAGLVLAANLWQRTQTILAAQPEGHKASAHPGRIRGAIAMEGLTFRYRDDGPLVLDNVSIRAEPGECIALTGPSGSGKSTLLNLLLRFENPQSGAIYLDGREISSLDIAAVRRQIGVVTQDGRLMAGSIFENISASGSHSMEEAWDAARAAGLAEDIENMPMGMHTVVSEGGGNLSGGQRQRLLIARALVLKPSILIFDEATSALDNRTQAIVTASLRQLKATRILVAHRLSTIRGADRIYVIEKGRVVQQGRFTELVSEPGLFARLASRQTA